MSLARGGLCRQLGLRLYAVASTAHPQPIVAAAAAPPKPPRSSYNIFQADEEVKAKAQEKAGSKNATECSRHVAELWKNLSAKEREKYDDIYKQKKEAYEAEYGPVKSKSSKPKSGGGTGRPTKYNAFVKANFGSAAKAINSSKGSDVFKELSARWKQLSDAEKQKYDADAEKINAA